MNASLLPHAESATETSRRLNVHPDQGLAVETIAAREREFGANKLPVTPPRPAWRVFAGQFSSALVLVLLGAAVLSAAIGNLKDAIVISCVVVINALFGFYQEYRAEQSLEALKSMLPAFARVRRSAITREIPADTLVPGDVVLVEAGDRIPADGRIIFAANLEIDESALTGESAPVGIGAANWWSPRPDRERRSASCHGNLPSPGTRRGEDRGWCKRRAGPDESRHRRRNGDSRHRGRERGCDHGADR